MENRFTDIYQPKELEFIYNMTRKKIGNINKKNVREYEKLEMYLELNEKIKHRTCSCNWKGLHNKLNGLITEFANEIAQAYEQPKNESKTTKRGRPKKEA